MDALSYITEGRKAFLVGIGGISMRALADVLAKRGLIVSGSDLRASEATDRLNFGGIPVFYGHRPSTVHARLRSSARRGRMMTIPKFRKHAASASRYLSGRRPGARLCAGATALSVFRARTEKPPPPRCLFKLPLRPGATRPP